MTEHEFFTTSVQHYIVDSKHICKEAVLSNRKRRHGASRVLFPIAACLVCILITVASIPKARAEVLSWFGWSTSPGEYLGKDSEAREAAEQVDALITEADGENADATVTNVGEFGRVSDLLAERLNATPLEALYDGDSVYVTLNLGGGFGVWLLENYTGGSVASVAIPPEKLGGFFNPSVPESFLSGEEVYYSHTTGQLVMSLPDGSEISGSVCIVEDETLAVLFRQASENPQDADALVAAYLAEHDVKAYAAMKADPARLKALADASGRIEGKLSLMLQIELEGSVTADPTTVLEADIGSIPVNVATYRTFAKQAAGNSDSAEWEGETILTYFDDSRVDKSTYGYNVYTNRVLSLDGLKMKALSAEADATGLKNLQVEVTFPSGWTEEEIRAFSGTYGIKFQLLINGETGEWTVSGVMRSLDMADPSKRVWHCRQAYGVPLGLLPEISELTLIPYISYCTAYYELDPDQSGELVVRGKTTPLNLDEPFSLWNEYYGGFDTSTGYYPQYAVSFPIHSAANKP